MIFRVAEMTMLLLIVCGITASGGYWGWRAYKSWQASAGLHDTGNGGGMLIAGAVIALACIVALIRIATHLVR